MGALEQHQYRGDQFDAVVDAFARVSAVAPKQTPRGVKVCCPAHDDKMPSLDITRGTDQPVLIKCWAGCDVEDVLAAAGLTWADVSADKPMPERPSSAPVVREVRRAPKPVVEKRAEYVYTDEHGTPAFRVVRRNMPDGSKRIYQERPTPEGKWVTGITAKNGESLIRPVPYRLPRVLAGVAADALIFVVEGESCVEAAESLGFIATTNHGGAGKWRSEYADYLAGARVVVLPDNDEAGRKHAAMVTESLSPVTASVTILDLPGLPEKGDLADFVASGGTADEVRAHLRASTQEKEIPAGVRVPELAPEAHYGPVGDIVAALEPTTEAAPAALMGYLLTSYGAMLGSNVTADVWGEPQHTCLFTVVTGASAAARKSTAARAIKPFLNMLNTDFMVERTEEGLASGEAIIDALKDDANDPHKDRRMLVNEDEFARLLEVTSRTGNTLVQVLLSGWDSATIGVRTKGSGKVRVSRPHIGVVGNVPDTDLRSALHGFSSGFANRFMYLLVDSPHDLPFPRRLSPGDVKALTEPLHAGMRWANARSRVLPLADEARDTYEALYLDHRRSQRVGKNARVTGLRAREVTNIVRIALIYAIIDQSETITSAHLEAAAAFVKYANDSVQIMFGSQFSERATTVLAALRAAPRETGMKRTEARALYANNWDAGQFEEVVKELTEAGVAVERVVPSPSGRGRPSQVLFLA